MPKKQHHRNLLKLKDPNDTLDFGRLVAEKDDNLAQYYVLPERFVKRAINIEDPATFFIGPKGIGKSAILQMVRFNARATGKRIVDIRPDDLAFSTLANAEATSPILGDASQHQWLFKVLCDYVLSLEVLRQEYPDASVLTGWLSALFQGKYEKEAKKLIALSQGDGTTLTNRILQLINEIELSGEYGGGKIEGRVSFDKSKRSSGEAFQLLGLVNSVAKKLRDNVSHSYYLLIDDLDLYWNNSPTQNAFIAALFSSLSHFSRPPSLKAVVALRENIYEALPLIDRDKFHDVVCNVRWDLASVRAIVEQRVVFKLTVRSSEVWGSVFPPQAFEGISHHSNGRPREAIRLATLAVSTASRNDHLSVTSEDMAVAIRTFSNERITEVSSEYSHTYPNLEHVIRKMSGWPKEFSIEKLSELLEFLDLEVQMKEPWADRYSWVSGYASNAKGFAQVLLECGILWLKQSRTDQAAPIDRTKPIEITDERWFAIHPMFGPGLGLIGA